MYVVLLSFMSCNSLCLQVRVQEAENSLSGQQRSNFKMVVVNNKPMHSWYNWLTAAGVTEDQVEVGHHLCCHCWLCTCSLLLPVAPFHISKIIHHLVDQLRCVFTPQLSFADKRLQKSAVHDVCNYRMRSCLPGNFTSGRI